MRIYLKTSGSQQVIAYNYQRKLVGCIHKWLGPNKWHDQISLFSLSWLYGKYKSVKKKGLIFDQGAQFFFSCPNPIIIKQLIHGIQESPEMFEGLVVQEVSLVETPSFGEEAYFYVQSPVLIKRTQEQNRIKFYFPEDHEANKLLTETLVNKLKNAGLEDKKINVSFDSNYPKAQKKVSTYNGIDNKASICPIRIQGDPEAVAFAWEVGVGNSTGIGFGALK